MTSIAALPRPEFVSRDPAEIESEMIAQYETLTGRTLKPGQIERLLIAVLAYRETLVRSAIQDAAEQNLLAYARYPMLDLLGEIVGVTRLGPQPAQATFQFTLTGVQVADVVIPQGTRIQTSDDKVTFATTQALTIAAGQTTGEVTAAALEAGALGNGYLAGEVTQLLDIVAFVAGAANEGTTIGGADQETDDALRARIQQAPEGFTVAGSIGAYRYHAMSVSSSIVDVDVTSPTPGNVTVFVLTSTGLPSDDLRAQVQTALSADQVRPLTDTVTVSAPVERDFTITATIDILRGADAASVMQAATDAANAYAADRGAGLGRDIVPSALIAQLSVAGAYRVTLVDPAYTEIGDGEWAHCTAIALTQGVTVDD